MKKLTYRPRRTPALLAGGVAFSLLVSACATPGDREDPSTWFDNGTQFDITEPVAFTDVNYNFPSDSAPGVADIHFILGSNDSTSFAADSFNSEVDCNGWQSESDLPVEVEGIVTILPRFYFKTFGCQRDDEKYYGSYFIQDGFGGIFVFGDFKVAHFDMGDRV